MNNYIILHISNSIYLDIWNNKQVFLISKFNINNFLCMPIPTLRLSSVFMISFKYILFIFFYNVHDKTMKNSEQVQFFLNTDTHIHEVPTVVTNSLLIITPFTLSLYDLFGFTHFFLFWDPILYSDKPICLLIYVHSGAFILLL